MSKLKVMTKVPMVKLLAEKTGIPKVQADFVYDVLMDLIKEKVREGHDIVFPHIGCLRHVKTKSRRSNMTGQTIPPHKRLRFKVNRSLAMHVRTVTREYPIK